MRARKICAISDLHGHLPPIEPCDLLIVAGDVCPDKFPPSFRFPDQAGQVRWMREAFDPWLAAVPAHGRVATWGNHDWCGIGLKHPAFVVDGIVETAFGRVWLSPWSNTFGGWAFMKPASELASIYARIPEGTDIIVSHQPPYGYGDMVDPRYIIGNADPHCGSRELLAAMERVRPKLVICGHIHGGYGRYEHDGIAIYNVSVVNEQYELVNLPTMIELPR